MGKVIHQGQSEKGNRCCVLPPTIKVLTKYNVEVQAITIGIFDTGRQLGHQIIFCVKDVPDPRGERVGKLALLKNVQVWPKFQVSGRISSDHFVEGCFPEVNTQAEHVPLAAQLKSQIRFSGQRAGGICEARGKGNIGLRKCCARSADQCENQNVLSHNVVS